MKQKGFAITELFFVLFVIVVIIFLAATYGRIKEAVRMYEEHTAETHKYACLHGQQHMLSMDNVYRPVLDKKNAAIPCEP